LITEQAALLSKARESLAVAHLLCAQGHYDFSASRSYCCMFYLDQALLLGRDLSFSKHSAVISSFGREFVKPGIVPVALHAYIHRAEEARLVGDYSSHRHIGEEIAQDHADHAAEFLRVMETVITQT
jgi:uncharacterized protein (UPF0332 family)